MVIKINFYDISSSLYYDFRHNILFLVMFIRAFQILRCFLPVTSIRQEE